MRIPDSAPAGLAGSFLETPHGHARAHAVQFYDGEEFLFDTVGRFLAAGLTAGDTLVVVAAPEHATALRQRIAAFGAGEVPEDRLLVLDAGEALAQFMVGGMPDANRFRAMLARVLATAKGASGERRVRAYGEMVNLLWRNGSSRAAVRLEELWNDALKDHPFSLVCAYQMGAFDREGDASRFLELCRHHSHVVPSESFSRIDDAGERLREVSLLQQRALALKSEVHHRRELEKALRDALRARARVEDELRVALRREERAREQADAGDAFKEMFLTMLGHDLRNPLNTILATATLMAMRSDLPPEGQKRVERLISAGDRMQRMIAQILDVTRARLGDGIPIAAHDVCDLSKAVARIVDAVRAANPSRTIELWLHGPCEARIDIVRIEQVLWNLIGNAIAHGDARQPVHVMVTGGPDVAIIVVHNQGNPIDPALLPTLFDPFRRGRPAGASDGLGVGLYISERIVEAHGGTIHVESSAEHGTAFEVILPRKI